MFKSKYMCVIILTVILIFWGIVMVDIKLNKSIECFNTNILSDREKNNFKVYVIQEPEKLRMEFKNYYIEIRIDNIRKFYANVISYTDKILDYIILKSHNFIESIEYNLCKTIDKL